MHGDCHQAERQKTPSGKRDKTHCCSSALLCARLHVLFLSAARVQWRKKVSFKKDACCCKVLEVCKEGRKEERKGRPADFPRPFPRFSRTSSLLWCRCASYVAGNLVHWVPRVGGSEGAAHTHTSTGFSASVQKHRAAWHTYTYTGIPIHPHDVILTQKSHWLRSGVLICSAVMWEACREATPPGIQMHRMLVNWMGRRVVVGGEGGERGGVQVRGQLYCTCCDTNVFPPELSFKVNRVGWRWRRWRDESIYLSIMQMKPVKHAPEIACLHYNATT